MTLTKDLEAATEGSRELSDRVLLACGWEQHRSDPNSMRPPGTDVWGWTIKRPDPTRSIDDALTLVPEGMAGTIEFSTARPTTFLVDMWNDSEDGTRPLVSSGIRRSLALALCIAVLKALTPSNRQER